MMSKKGVAIQMKPFDHEFCLRNVFFHKARQRVIVPEMASSSLLAKPMLAALFPATKATIIAQSIAQSFATIPRLTWHSEEGPWAAAPQC